ncbi:Cytochrome P450 monooxygenase TRI13 [Colletotrichum trifolii]|uniref:Cytochrome P450 monooxygenase TRI13 n=1 Tax=Colletotrichum trifolii TaxID=5466 RepID=A0A4R8RVA9_COLTR|nr:Cytochrome P450 monooxygenase TRI13 [Colletotrichum trifolii]
MEKTGVVSLLVSSRAPILLAGAVLLAAYLVYRTLLPRPIPGIPYNKKAAASLLGDMPELLGHSARTGEMYDWLGAQNVKHNAPVVQVFGRPLGRPWVIVSDFFETQDILTRRVRELDISDFTADLLGGVIPEHHSRWVTGDEWKNRRRLVGDILTPSFLEKVAAPLLHESTARMTALWREKARLAQGRPFSGLKDISHCALDAVLAFTFGPGLEGLSATQPDVDRLASLLSLDGVEMDVWDEPVAFPRAPPNPVLEALLKISDSLETAMKSLFPVLAHWFLRQGKQMKNAIRLKEDFLRRQIDLAALRVRSNGQGEGAVRCAIDDMVRRESWLAAKERRPPAFHTRSFYDELYGFTLGGHESTSNSNQWAIKILASHQAEQAKLRAILREAFPEALAERRVPTAQEITQARCPYLDASIEELFRVSLTAPAVARSATQDTQILGCHIPKGTVVFVVWNQASYTEPGLPVDVDLRSPAARAAMSGKASGPEDSKFSTADYVPERYLVRSGDGTRQVFDPSRGRNMIFSMGPRGCYGRKLAYVQMRMLVVLVLWSFQLEELPQELNTVGAYDKLTREPYDCCVRLTSL